MTLVVDASVALKWFLRDEPDADRALAILKDGALLVAPDIVVAEVCNAAWKSARLGRLTWAQVSEIAASLPAFFDSLVVSAPLAVRAVEIAERLDHPVYDALYLAVAESQHANLITADLHLVGKINKTQWKDSVVTLGTYGSIPSDR